MKIKFNNIFKLFGVLFALLLFKGVSVSAANPVIDSSEYTGYSDIYDGGVGKHYYHIRYAKVNGLDQYSFYSAKEGESKKTTHSTLLEIINDIDTLRYNEEYGLYYPCILSFNGEIPENITLEHGKYYVTGYIAPHKVNGGAITVVDTTTHAVTADYYTAPEITISNSAMVIFENFSNPYAATLNVVSKISVSYNSSLVIMSSNINFMNYTIDNLTSTTYALPSSGLSNSGKAFR